MNDTMKSIYLAGEILKNEFFNLNTYCTKEKYDLVTKSDYLIESILVEHISKEYPEDSIFSEERGQINDLSERRWIIDPIDGTANFVFGVPYFCISLCLIQNSKPVEAYVYNPLSNEFYYTDENIKKSYLNNNEINVSDNIEISESIGVFGFSANTKNIKRYLQEWELVFEKAKKGLPLLSPALNICNVARGRIDFFIDFGSNMEGHCASSLILKNAGGKTYNYDFTEWDYESKGVIASNGKVPLSDYKNVNT